MATRDAEACSQHDAAARTLIQGTGWQRPPGRLTEVIVEESRAGADRQHILQFMTTEHFTLQTARAVANAEITSRLQLYLGTLSSAIIALALTAQLSGLGIAFRGFALVLLPGCSSWGW